MAAHQHDQPSPYQGAIADLMRALEKKKKNKGWGSLLAPPLCARELHAKKLLSMFCTIALVRIHMVVQRLEMQSDE